MLRNRHPTELVNRVMMFTLGVGLAIVKLDRGCEVKRISKKSAKISKH